MALMQERVCQASIDDEAEQKQSYTRVNLAQRVVKEAVD